MYQTVLNVRFLLAKKSYRYVSDFTQVSLRFNGKVSINIECDFDHAPVANNLRSVSPLPEKAAGLVSLLGNKVASALSKAGKILEIRFTDNQTSKVYDSNESYESFQVITQIKRLSFRRLLTRHLSPIARTVARWPRP